MKTSQASISDETASLIDSEKKSPTLNSENNATNEFLQQINDPPNINFNPSEGTLLFIEGNQNFHSQIKNPSRQNKLGFNANDLNQFIDKENIPIPLEPEKIDSSLIEDNVIVPSQKIIDRPENSSPKFSIYYDDDDENNLLKSLNDNEVETEKTIIGEESMDCTMTADNFQIPCENLNKKTAVLPLLVNKQKNFDNECDILAQNRMSMTAVIPSILHTVNDQINHSRMEITEAVPSLLNRQSINYNPQQVFHQSQMEMTTAISSILNKQKQPDNQTLVSNKNRMSMTTPIVSVLHRQLDDDDRTQFFQHDGMEMTQALTSVLKNKNIPVNQSQMEMTSGISSVLTKPISAIDNQHVIETTETITSILNKQKIYNNQNRMSMTAAIPSVLHSQRVVSNETRFDQSQMEINSAIPSVISKQKTFDSQTRELNQNRMSMTTAIPSTLHRLTPTNEETRVDQENINETIKTIPSDLNQQKIHNEESRVINQNRMSLTTAIPSILHQQQIDNSQNRVTVISSTPSASPSGVLRNYSEELTGPISTLKRNYTIIRSPHHLRDTELASPIPKLQINRSSFVKIPTEQDRQALHRILHQNSSDPEDLQSNSNKNLDISMEFTAAVPSNFHPQNNSVNIMLKTMQENEDDSLETTEPINNFAHSTILTDMHAQSTDKNQTNDIDVSQTSNKIIDDIIPSMARAGISSDIDAFDKNSLKENNPPDDYEVINNRSVVRELFEPDEIQEPIVEITKSFPVDCATVHDQLTEKISVITNCLGPSEVDQSQQYLEEIEEPSFCVNTQEFSEQVYSFEREITENIKIWEKKNIRESEEAEETSNNFDFKYFTHQENQENSTVKDEEEKNESLQIEEESFIDERIFIKNCDEGGILSQNHTARKRSLLGIFEDEITPENNKRCKLSFDGTPESSSDDSPELDSSESEKSFNKFMSTKLKIQEIPEPNYEINKLVSESKNKISDTNLKIQKYDSSLKEIMASINKKKLELKMCEEKIKKTKVVGKMTKEKLKLENLIESSESNEQKSPFEMMKKSIETYALKSECIWQIKSIDPRRIIIEYYKTSLWLVIGVNVPENPDSIERIKGVKIISRLSPKEDTSLRITDRLILEGINVNNLQDNYKIYDDILKLVKDIDDKITSIYDFYDDLVKLERQNLMEISLDKISFISRTSKMNIILKILINVKPFEKIRPDDVTVECLVGSLK